MIFAVQSSAYAVTAIATVGTNNGAPNVFYAGGVAGNFNLGTNNAYLRSKLGVGFGFNPNITVQFSPMVGIPASYVFNADGVWHLWLGDPNDGFTNFTVFDHNNGNIMLRGQVQKAILHGRNILLRWP